MEVPERQKSPSDSEHKRLDQTEDEPNSSPRGIETSELVAPGLSRALNAEDSDQQRSCQASPSGSTVSSEDETQFKMSPDTPDVKPQQLHGETRHISVSHGDTEASPTGQRDLLTCGQQGLDLQESGAELASQTASSYPNESADGASGVDGGINLTGQKQSGKLVYKIIYMHMYNYKNSCTYYNYGSVYHCMVYTDLFMCCMRTVMKQVLHAKLI